MVSQVVVLVRNGVAMFMLHHHRGHGRGRLVGLRRRLYLHHLSPGRHLALLGVLGLLGAVVATRLGRVVVVVIRSPQGLAGIGVASLGLGGATLHALPHSLHQLRAERRESCVVRCCPNLEFLDSRLEGLDQLVDRRYLPVRPSGDAVAAADLLDGRCAHSQDLSRLVDRHAEVPSQLLVPEGSRPRPELRLHFCRDAHLETLAGCVRRDESFDARVVHEQVQVRSRDRLARFEVPHQVRRIPVPLRYLDDAAAHDDHPPQGEVLCVCRSM
mmetsp:Transcript_3986/g.9551  ORF Transcript_3986/g.9551 Transcript_3986/m.9551 type:complete len:271 (+) Transcript_3986:247-1059(+)